MELSPAQEEAAEILISTMDQLRQVLLMPLSSDLPQLEIALADLMNAGSLVVAVLIPNEDALFKCAETRVEALMEGLVHIDKSTLKL